jgi:hypothetical protein
LTIITSPKYNRGKYKKGIDLKRRSVDEKLIIGYANISDDLSSKLKDERCKLIYSITLRTLQNINDEARAGVQEAIALAPARASY